MSQYIPDKSSIIEFGAGRLILKDFINDSCTYQSSDLISREPSTIVCDLNSDDLPNFKPYDIAFFSGVLEYVVDLDKIMQKISPKMGSFIVSYATRDKIDNMTFRRNQGWLSHFTNEDLLCIFREYGFELKHKDFWTNQDIYVFDKRK